MSSPQIPDAPIKLQICADFCTGSTTITAASYLSLFAATAAAATAATTTAFFFLYMFATAPPAGHEYGDTEDSFVSFHYGAVALLLMAAVCISFDLCMKLVDKLLYRRLNKEPFDKLYRRFEERHHCFDIAKAEEKATIRDWHISLLLLCYMCSFPTSCPLLSDADFAGAEHGIKEGKAKTSAAWIAATAAPHHATGNRDLLSGFIMEHDDQFVHAVDGIARTVLARGAVITGSVVLPDVWYVPGLTENLVSVSQLVELDYNVGFSFGKCCISSTDGKVVGKGHLQKGGLYVLDFLKVPLAK